MNDNYRPTAGWDHHPPVPIPVSPLFTRPINLKSSLQWIIRSWIPITERLIILFLSILSWKLFHPTLQQAKTLEVSWIAEIYLRNLGLIFLVAGGLHLYFFVLNQQGNDKRFDARPLRRNASLFSFNNQVRDNMFWTCASGVTIWSAYEVLMMWALANGYAPMLSGPGATVWLIVLLLLVPIWETFYFYLVHRLLHWPPLYKTVHYLHHRNTNVGPWSGLSMHPVEHILYLGSVLVHWIVAAHPLLIIYHLQYYTLSAATTHSGYEGIYSKNKKWLSLGTFHHQLHHRYFECNYGGLEIPWDKWFGSFHDGTVVSHQRFKDRRKQINASRR